MLQFLNKDAVCALNGAKFMILSVFGEYFVFWVSCKTPCYAHINNMRLEYNKV